LSRIIFQQFQYVIRGLRQWTEACQPMGSARRSARSAEGSAQNRHIARRTRNDMHRPLLFSFSIIAALAGPVHAADWPTRPVTVIVPFGAGGNTDMMARLGAQHLTAKLGQTFVIENKPSAGGSLGTGQV